MIEKVEFTLLNDGRILDLRPMYTNKPALVYQNGTWDVFAGSIKEMMDSKPINNEKVETLIFSKDILQ